LKQDECFVLGTQSEQILKDCYVKEKKMPNEQQSKIKIVQLILIFLIFFCTYSITFAGTATGDFSTEVLDLGVGARALAMGGAFVAEANDSSAAYWNPAGLAQIHDVQISTLHATQSSIQNYDFFNLAFNLPQLGGTYAISYIRLSVSGIPITPASGPIVLGYTQDAEQVGLISGGWQIAKQLMLGVSLKLIQESLYTASAFGVGADVGFLYKPFPQFGIGLNIQNVTDGTDVQWSNTPTNPTYVVPISAKIGVSYTAQIGPEIKANNTWIPSNTITANLDVDTQYANQSLNDYHIGVEYWYHQFFAVRGGVQTYGLQFNQDNMALSAGIGVWVYLFEVDYAYVDYSISPTNYLSLITRF
jgi:hypothetical protein